MIPVPPLEFFRKGMEYAGRGGHVGGHVNLNETNCRRFKSFFGVSAGGCTALWNELIPFLGEFDQKVEFFHLLWACMFVKLYDPINVLSGMVKVDEKTFTKWVWILLRTISVHVKPRLIHLGLRFERSNGARQLLSVDGTDCPTNMKFDRSFYSHKFKASGVRYEVSLCIQTGKICSVVGPFPCGSWPDINIYRYWLKNQLQPNEKVEADAGYRGDPTVRDPDDCNNYGEHRMKFNARARHEHVNQRLKNFQCLDHFRHFTSRREMTKHRYCFDTVCTLVQINLYSGDELGQVYYVDY